MNLHSLLLYFVMGSQDCPKQNPVEMLQLAIQGGITCFQFREKASSLSLRETVQLGYQLKQICADHQIPFIVNDRVDLAMILGATGVHLGQADLPADEVRRMLGPDDWIGVSAKTPAEARQACRDGANYIGVGPLFPTSSKQDTGPIIGPKAIHSIRANIHIPIVGIGGITPEHAPCVIEAGAQGVAVISAIAKADEPEQAVKTFLRYLSLTNA
jgi:thiamine-phosphate pyrophosphorylase